MPIANTKERVVLVGDAKKVLTEKLPLMQVLGMNSSWAQVAAFHRPSSKAARTVGYPNTPVSGGFIAQQASH
ncbi:hypothetical protein Pcac1_g9521 [Phytophthora cactorum]|nr:hypothetical protein Pcac1_g9521 [Phytophthora cactorum]KAG2922399.1 hypothetical protein PC114_g5269 [Phytophthora cactorum]KAG3178219.1 hypothetical protein PC128_g16496 [Phytophthora cactorum]KAG3179543.1 hypothetical protein C6341_g7451 [Phytophthora cactorum]KAG4051063.1 hypothetical protein PC123_g13703 [Phytophthora cactorum]